LSYCRCLDGSVGIWTRLLATRPKIRVKFPTETGCFCLLRNAPDRFCFHQTSYLKGTRDRFPCE
jgi:hypothetical protein